MDQEGCSSQHRNRRKLSSESSSSQRPKEPENVDPRVGNIQSKLAAMAKTMKMLKKSPVNAFAPSWKKCAFVFQVTLPSRYADNGTREGAGLDFSIPIAMGSHAGANGSGLDGLIPDDPKMAYTEKVLEEKEQVLRKYIQDNYSKIQNVERELAGLTMEVKLTAGPKKAALEHLRKLIEVSTEKIKAAKVKEEQAKKVWEAALKAVETEEANKQRLCDDLKCLVQQSAEAQYSRLEELTNRLEALNPGLQGGASQLLTEGIQSNPSNGTTQHQHSSQQSPDNSDDGNKTTVDGNNLQKVSTIVASINSHQSPSAVPDSPTHSATSPEPDGQVAGSDKAQSSRPVARGQHVAVPRGRGRRAGRIRGPLQLGRSKSETENGGWTGAGFDVDDDQS